MKTINSSDALIIFGLGNPGNKYTKTRHNVGFIFLDWLLQTVNDSQKIKEKFKKQNKFNAETAALKVNKKKIILVKPLTFMNKSGDAVGKLCEYHKISPANILVVHDDIDLPFGSIRISKNSSSAGHNGINSIIHQLGTKDFTRLRVGISNQHRNQTPSEKFVLDHFSTEEQAKIKKILLEEIGQALDNVLEKSFDLEANKHSGTTQN